MQQMNYNLKRPWTNPWYEVDPDEPRMPKQTWDPNQNEIIFFFPLTEQIPLDLDYTDCAKPQLTLATTYNGSTGFTLNGASWTTTTPQLSVSPNNPVGSLSIGGIQVGMESEPKWYQKILYKVLGFKWHQK